MKNRKKAIKVEPLIFDTYLAAVKNSRGVKLFRDNFALISGKRKNITEGGRISCAFFVSSILLIFCLVKKMHVTVDGTIKDMEESGWKKIKKPKPGAVLVWEAQKFSDVFHKHLGFYLGEGKAISNNYKKRFPDIHDWKFAGARKLESIWWHNKLKRKMPHDFK